MMPRGFLEFDQQDQNTAYANTLNKSHTNLERLLRLIDYSRGVRFSDCRLELRDTIIAGVQQSGAKVLSRIEFLFLELSKEKAATFDDT